MSKGKKLKMFCHKTNANFSVTNVILIRVCILALEEKKGTGRKTKC
jgi:hypothetical protein